MSRTRREKKTAKKGLDILKDEIQKLIQIELDKRQREESTEAAVENEPELKRYGNHIYKTGYKREYCQMILRHAEEGKSIHEFAATIGVNPRTISRWADRYPEFNDAKEVAKVKLEAFWWALALKHMKEKFTYEVFLFAMVNHFNFRNPIHPVNFNGTNEIKGSVIILPESKSMDQVLKEEEEERNGRYQLGEYDSGGEMETGGDLEAAEDTEETA